MIDIEDTILGVIIIVAATFLLTALCVGRSIVKADRELFSVANEACQFRRIEVAVVDGDGNIYCADREDLVMFRAVGE